MGLLYRFKRWRESRRWERLDRERRREELKQLQADFKSKTKYKIPAIYTSTKTPSGEVLTERTDGPFVLILRQKASDPEHGQDQWELLFSRKKKGSRTERRIGGFYIGMPRPTDGVLAPSMQSSDIDYDQRGFGLGKVVYSLLVEHYGALESDSRGWTSDKAQRVWNSLGAKKVGKRFRLEVKDLKKKYSSMR